jgi:hypothetical protein
MGTAKLHQQLEKSQLSSDLLSQEIFSSKISLKEIGSKQESTRPTALLVTLTSGPSFLGCVWGVDG